MLYSFLLLFFRLILLYLLFWRSFLRALIWTKIRFSTQWRFLIDIIRWIICIKHISWYFYLLLFRFDAGLVRKDTHFLFFIFFILFIYFHVLLDLWYFLTFFWSDLGSIRIFNVLWLLFFWQKRIIFIFFMNCKCNDKN